MIRRASRLKAGTIATVMLGVAVLAFATGEKAAAQATTTGVVNALQGFSTNRDEEVQIEAATLEVRDKEKMATFTGDVRLVQGDTVLVCKVLHVYYEDNSRNKDVASAVKTGVGRDEQRIRRVVAQGGVTVTQGEQSATGDTGVFDMRSNTVTLTGNVVVSRGGDVLRGHKLTVDITNGVSTIESGSGPVEGLFRASGGPAAPSRAQAGTPDRESRAPRPLPPPLSLQAN